eukprot:8628932-Lingulodinium_polyedra.AAC.1
MGSSPELIVGCPDPSVNIFVNSTQQGGLILNSKVVVASAVARRRPLLDGVFWNRHLRGCPEDC